LLLLGAAITAILALALDGIVATGSRQWMLRHGGLA
jgi:osmoprotectant transport system permease protein